jgi:hypothetical protein
MALKGGSAGLPTHSAESDAQGRIRFEKVRYGTYSVSLTLRQSFLGTTDLSIPPGEPLTRTIVLPSQDKPFSTVIKVQWPQDIAARSPQIVFGKDSLQPHLPHPGFQDPIYWSSIQSESKSRAPVIWVDNAGGVFSRDGGFIYKDRVLKPTHGPGFLSRVTLRASFDPTSELEWPGKEFQVTGMWVVVPLTKLDAKPVSDERFATIRINSSDWNHQFSSESGRTTLVLTPTEDANTQIREGFAAIDKFWSHDAESESVSVDDSNPPASGDAASGSAVSN